MQNTKIYSLQGLRALAFMAVFSEHVGLTKLGGWGVTVFLMMSGFLNEIRFETSSQKMEWHPIKNISLAWKRIEKLYVLHLITMITALLCYWENQRLDSMRHIFIWIVKFIANATLLHAWFPKSEFYWSFNAVSWFMSVMLFLYYITPYVIRVVSIIGSSIKKAKYTIVLVIAIQVFFSTLVNVFSPVLKSVPLIISDNLVLYLTYIWPIYRIGDYLIGCLIGKIYILTKDRGNSNLVRYSATLVTIIEIFLCFLLAVIDYVYKHEIGILGLPAFRETILSLLPGMCFLICAVYENGLLSQIVLKSQLLVAIGDLSGYAFLIHQLVIVMCGRLKINGLFKVILSAALTFLLTRLFCKIRLEMQAAREKVNN